MPNGFVLADARKALAPIEPVRVDHEVVYAGRALMTLDAVVDLSRKRTEFVAVVVRTAVVAVALIVLLGLALWSTLKRAALQPLEMEIGRREEKERELLQRTAELGTALREPESFSYSVSHDLRAPLRAIDGYRHALLEDYGPRPDDTARVPPPSAWAA